MNYKHIFHAGNFADVIKHLTLVLLLEKLIKKNSPFSILDCFAGSGLYDLGSENAIKTNESRIGIEQIFHFSTDYGVENLPILIKQYLTIIKNINKNSNCLRFYPGSPIIIANYLREKDKLIASELHPDEYDVLKKTFYRHPNVHLHHSDAYSSLKAFTPLPTNRGMLFIDPPFEKTDEFDKIIKYLKLIQSRVKSNIITIWYPIKDLNKINVFYQQLQQMSFKEILKLEFKINLQKFGSVKETSMKSMGILIVNPPEIQEELSDSLSFITQNMYKNHAIFELGLLK